MAEVLEMQEHFPAKETQKILFYFIFQLFNIK